MAEKRLAELKARCPDLDAVRGRLRTLAVHESTVVQRDTYFAVPRGRLKLREVDGRPAQLIQYERPDVAAVKSSRIRLVDVERGDDLRVALAAALGVRARVVKRRETWRWDDVQVRLDAVEGHGTFVELLAPVGSDAEHAAAVPRFTAMLARLGLGGAALVAGSYADLAAAE